MRITIFLLMFCAFCSYAGNTYSQAARVNIKMSNAKLDKILNEIESQTDYLFIYNNQVDVDRTASVTAKNEPVSQVLDKLLKGTNIHYKLEGDHIILTKQASMETDNTRQQQTKRITGTVTDAKGEPVFGANVHVKGTTTGTITDVNGKFSIEIEANQTIEVTCIGYLKQQVNVGNHNTLKIVLQEDAQTLEEVVVVGYGTQKKVNLTGSVASVSADQIKDRVETNVLSAIQGTVPGVTVISRPGQTPSINFRGRGNLGTSAPLYVIDGAISDATFFQNLDPNSIESISFLKDAASSAIYGSRAAYGVVLVTTKNGKSGKLNVTYSGYAALKNPTYTPELVNSSEYASLMNEAKYNINPKLGKNQAYSEEEIGWFKDGSKPDYYPDTDWLDLTLDKNRVTTQHSLNFSGGTEKLRYFTGLGYLYEDSYTPGKNNYRYNLDTNISSDLNKWLTFRAGIKYIRNTSSVDNGTPSLMNYLIVPSIMVAKQSNGEWGTIAGGKQATLTFINGNPLRALSKNNWNNSATENSMIDLGFDVKPIKGLVITGQGSYRRYEYKYKSYTGLQDNAKFFETGNEISGTGNEVNSMSMSWASNSNLLTTLTAKYDFSVDKHTFGVLAGTSYENYKYEALSAYRKNFPSDGLTDISAGSTEGATNGGGSSEYKMNSYFGRINYAFNDRYLFEANMRADASSRFYKTNRWGYFPSFSAAWRINEEEFMKELDWIQNLKLRASYGTLGNINNVGNYDYFQNYSKSGSYTFDDTLAPSIAESKPSNKSLSWEKVALTDFGVDFEIFGGKLGITADYYIKKTSNILLTYNVPYETGISVAPSQNLGKVENKGFEFAINHRNKIADFSYNIAANIATNKNKIIDLATSDNMIQAGGDKINYILKVGESIGSYYGYKTDGLYTQAEIDEGHYYKFGRVPKAGDIKYVPQRSNVAWGSSITSDDRTIIGKDVPDFTYGLNLNLQWKNFEFSLFGQGVSGTNVAFESEQVWCLFLNSNPRKWQLNRWTEDNPNPRAIYPRIYGGTSSDNYNQYFSDYQVFDADYFRIKTMSLGYKVPDVLVKKAGLSSLKLFATGENLFTIRADHRMKDFDPEAATGRGLSAYGLKSVAFGVNVSF
ncbi:TonB-dependent receptor [Bacteroides sedimenti]|uniref:SusC/RagA family TonB-linked outer membrane protein n=1 Tax=Bacteroides sedimenti TaxID=2136147 RepID=A0ABM8IB00_9BACE